MIFDSLIFAFPNTLRIITPKILEQLGKNIGHIVSIGVLLDQAEYKRAIGSERSLERVEISVAVVHLTEALNLAFEE